MADVVAAEPLAELDYAEVVDAATLEPARRRSAGEHAAARRRPLRHAPPARQPRASPSA